MTAPAGHPAGAGEYTAGGTAGRPGTGHNGLVNGEWRTAARGWLRTKANSIEGGTSEVQLNVIAKRILELPGA